MRLAKLIAHFAGSPAVALLRSRSAPFVADFLDQQFKRAGRITIAFSDLCAALAGYRDDLREKHPEALRERPETLLADWCSGETRWLQRFHEAGRDEPVCQLTPSTEEVLTFLAPVLEPDLGFVGTESRLRLAVETLADLAAGASEDPEERLEHLRAEKEKLEREIRRIEEAEDGAAAARYPAAAIRERFGTALSLLRQLQGDFRAVEEKFKEITRQVGRRLNQEGETRGDILEYALNAEDVLKREDQGVTFHEFVRLILSPARQESLQNALRRLARVRELAGQSEGLDSLVRMMPLLLAEAEKVMRTNQRLSAALRRLLDGRGRRERLQVGRLLRDIRGMAASMAADPPREVAAEVETEVAIASPFARTFWSEPPRFATLDLTEQMTDPGRRADAFRALARLHRLDWRVRGRVRDSVARLGPTTLGGLLSEHPPQAGVVEVLGYLQIACDDGHAVSRDAAEEIVLPPRVPGGRPLAVTVPLVRFAASAPEVSTDPTAGSHRIEPQRGVRS